MAQSKKYAMYQCEIAKFEKLNSQFAKVVIKVCYHGKNRNRTSLSKDLLEKMAQSSLKLIPIVGEWKPDNNDFGSHGGKIELSDEGIKFIDTTKPYGVVPDNTEYWWETVREKDGLTEHEYLYCTGILWVGRYPECEKILDNGANQSMEIVIDKYSYDQDDYLVVEDAEFSALCILGDDVEPCFEGAGFDNYSNTDFKSQFEYMVNKYGELENKQKASGEAMEKIIDALSSYVFKNSKDEDVCKYVITGFTDTTVNVIDREDEYKAYTIGYTVSENEGEDRIVLDFDNKVEQSIGVIEKSEAGFNVKAEIDSVSASAIYTAIQEHESAVISDLNEKLEKLQADYDLIKGQFEFAQSKLDEIESDKKKAEFELHKKNVDEKIASFSERLGKYPDYLVYCSKPDYEKTVEQIDVDLTMIAGRYSLGQKSNLFYQPNIYSVNKSKTNENSRYGNLFDKVKK